MMRFNELGEEIGDLLRRSNKGQSYFPFAGCVCFGMCDLAFYLQVVVVHIDEGHQKIIRYRAAEHFDGQPRLAGIGDAADAEILRIAAGIERNA